MRMHTYCGVCSGPTSQGTLTLAGSACRCPAAAIVIRWLAVSVCVSTLTGNAIAHIAIAHIAIAHIAIAHIAIAHIAIAHIAIV
jgi:hypothetical protein